MRRADSLPRVVPSLLTVACAVMVLSPWLGSSRFASEWFTPSWLPAAWARAPFALGLVLWLPGRSLVGLALPGSVLSAELSVLSVALSLAVTVLTGLALNVAGALDATGWGLALSGLSLLALALTPRQTLREPVDRVSFAGPGPSAGLSRRVGDAAMLALGLGLGAGAYSYARAGAEVHDQYRYTEMWMVPVGATPGASATLGLRNAERVRTTYDVEVLDGGEVVGRWPRVALAAGETMTVPVNASRGPVARRLAARVFKDGDRTLVYRQVWIDVPPEAHPAAVRE